MWIKICGIRDVPTACQIAELRPDALGLNFYAGTPRSISVETAVRIVEQLPADIEPVGVFVNHSVQEIIAITRDCGLNMVQLHGDETPEFTVELIDAQPELRIIRACRVGADGLEPLAGNLARYRELGVTLFACLIDARVEGLYGGSGATVSWDLLDREYRSDQWPPLLLAGGLTPENVQTALRAARPWGVDVASGVETSPGHKDFQRVADFIAAVRGAR